MLELYYRPFVVSPPPSVRDGARILGVARRARHINALSVLDQLRATLSRSVKVPVTRHSIPTASVWLNPGPSPVTLWVTEARRVLVTATSWSCVLGPKLRL